MGFPKDVSWKHRASGTQGDAPVEGEAFAIKEAKRNALRQANRLNAYDPGDRHGKLDGAPGAGTPPWEKVSGETLKAYTAFKAYRDMGNERSFVAVSKNSGKHYSQISGWSKKYDWRRRADAYDRHLERVERHAMEKERKKMYRDHARVADALLARSAKRLSTLKDEDISPSALAKLVEVATRLGRSSRGDPEVVTAQRIDARVESKAGDAVAELLGELSRIAERQRSPNVIDVESTPAPALPPLAAEE